MKHLALLLASSALALAACSPSAPPPAEPAEPAAQEIRVEVQRATESGAGDSLGTVTFREADGRVLINVDLSGLPGGEHGFHLHEHASCAPHSEPGGAITPAGAAGAHYDPEGTGTHAGPEGAGHLGDLPRLEADAEGRVQAELNAPRITALSQVRGRALMIHAGGDNYTDTPANGGGGARLGCVVIN
ncbi:MAG TPA: superoxide dismutase family protein [Terricaulis sp.]|nr:superoxide dismutase family protein [Terricaulis sp.]